MKGKHKALKNQQISDSVLKLEVCDYRCGMAFNDEDDECEQPTKKKKPANSNKKKVCSACG